MAPTDGASLYGPKRRPPILNQASGFMPLDGMSSGSAAMSTRAATLGPISPSRPVLSFYRVNVVHLCIPPPRKRPEDILWYAHRFLREVAQQTAVPRQL
jgi:hypothetical protein